MCSESTYARSYKIGSDLFSLTSANDDRELHEKPPEAPHPSTEPQKLKKRTIPKDRDESEEELEDMTKEPRKFQAGFTVGLWRKDSTSGSRAVRACESWAPVEQLLRLPAAVTGLSKGTASDVAETSKKEGGAKGEHATPEKKDELSHTEERQEDSKNRPAVDDAAYAAEGVNPPQSSEDMDTNGYASSKRPLDTTDKKTTDSHAEGPPAKTTVTTRAASGPAKYPAR
ncbi:hypothetical protein HPB50_022282 [Hyalomma asiaticum]|uniref:Uncharacterized protein n=1 Tax=Hyalomma asiaticum TaxID=266040 RepID=A0ACB7TP16_HYAAI|nr:hypothetical protein HPB50_022282 [Hyalomma asiaticum]